MTRLLLQGVGAGWAERVFFSDNGSSAIEVRPGPHPCAMPVRRAPPGLETSRPRAGMAFGPGRGR